MKRRNDKKKENPVTMALPLFILASRATPWRVSVDQYLPIISLSERESEHFRFISSRSLLPPFFLSHTSHPLPPLHLSESLNFAPCLREHFPSFVSSSTYLIPFLFLCSLSSPSFITYLFPSLLRHFVGVITQIAR